MEFEITADRSLLRETVRRLVTDLASERAIRTAMDSEDGLDPTLWSAFERLGLLRLRTTEPGAVGAQENGSFRDLAVVVEELGRGPVCAPYLGSAVLAPELLRRCTTAAAAEFLARLDAGAVRATASLDHDFIDAASLPITLRTDDRGRTRASGTATFVVDADSADFVLLPAIHDTEVAVIAVETADPSVGRVPLFTMDRTRRAARVELADTPVVVLETGAPAIEALTFSRHVAQVAIACEQVGGATRCLEMSVEYSLVRKQFGAPIGSFQAIKHRCADMLAAIELARSCAEYAAWCIDCKPEDVAVSALTAGSLCSQMYVDIAASAIQVHGGIGFTWDHPAHLFFKRAKANSLMFGQPAQLRTELADALGV